MNRSTRIFLAALAFATATLGTARAIGPGIDGTSVLLGMIRFILISAGAAAAVAVWAVAVFAAAHEKTWPLVVALATLVGSTLAFALS